MKSVCNDEYIDIPDNIPEEYYGIYKKLYTAAVYDSNPSHTFQHILCNNQLPESILAAFAAQWDWEEVPKYQKMSFEFALNYDLDWYAYILNPLTEEKEIEKMLTGEKFHSKAVVRLASERKNLSGEFIERYKNQFDWHKLSKTIKFELIPKYTDCIDWNVLISRLSQETDTEAVNIIRTYSNYINWTVISHNNWSISFMNEFVDKLDWDIISENCALNGEIFNAFLDKLNWNIISKRKLSIELLRQYKSRLNWEFCSHLVQTQELLNEFKDVISWDTIDIKRLVLPEDILERYIDKFSKNDISRYQKLSEAFIRRHLSKVDLPTISTYQNISEDFREEFDLI